MATEHMENDHERTPVVRRGYNDRGRSRLVLANHFHVTVNPPSDGCCFYAYTVTFKHIGRGVLVCLESLRRQILDKLFENREFAYDGESSLFTVATPLFPENCPLNETVNDLYDVSVVFDKMIPINGGDDGVGEEQFRVFDAILRQSAIKDGCFVIGRTRFSPNGFKDLKGGIASCRGHCWSFKTTQKGVTLNIDEDASTALIISAPTVKEFLLLHQGVTSLAEIDWLKAEGTLKNLWIKAPSPSNMECKINGLSDLRCNEQMVLVKEGTEEMEMTVYDYYVHQLSTELHESGGFPCIDVGDHNQHAYIPIEVCSLVPFQCYTEPLSCEQQARLFNSWPLLGPGQMMGDLIQALCSCNYDANSLLNSCGVSISTALTRVEARVLKPTPLVFGSKKTITSNTGTWDIDSLKLVCARKLEYWPINEPLLILNEKPENANKPASVRVDEMIKDVFDQVEEEPLFLLCLLPENKNSQLYGPLKRKTLLEVGITTQCVATPNTSEAPPNYIRNMLLKINAKLFGLNWVLGFELPEFMRPLCICEVNTFIIGMGLYHAPGKPSIAAAVGTLSWPNASRYVAATRSQPLGSQIIQALCQKLTRVKDAGMFRQLLLLYIQVPPYRLPERIIIFRDGDGVSESEFDQVLKVELDQIVEACKLKDESWSPKMMVVVARQRHNTRFFRANNVLTGTMVDAGVCHPRNNDFYFCAQGGSTGTERPTHYHVVHDDIGCSESDLHELVHALSLVYQPSNTAVSIVAPILYARRAAAKMSEVAQSLNPDQDLPKLHEHVFSSMYFC
ncbi:hypothetical protein OROGR_009095 [Orobanche gracilis]